MTSDWSSKTSLDIQKTAQIILSSRKGVVLTGAGISTPSGIPDFRSPEDGLWGSCDPLEVASLNSFRYDPIKFYHWMKALAKKIVEAKPNAAHVGLVDLERVGIIKTIITQNIDALHKKAGSKNVLEVHGTLETLTCVSCYRKYSSADFIKPYVEDGVIPYCTYCGNILKPDLMLFGEQLPAKTWLKAVEASRSCDLMIVAGSSLEVLPVAGLPMRALENGAHMIVINHSHTYLDVRADVVFHEDVAKVIPAIVEVVQQINE